MAALHLVGDRRGHVIEGKVAGLARHLGMEDDLEQKVAELVLERGHVGFADRLGDLVGLLDGVGGDRGEILLAVPRAAAVGIAQPGHDFE